MRKLIRWSELSRLLTGTRHSIRHENYCPEKYKAFVNDLMDAVKDVCEKHGLKFE